MMRGRVVVAVVGLVAVGVVVAGVRVGTSGSDVDGGRLALGALAEVGVLDGTGCRGRLHCPDEPLLRWVMAVWIVRALGLTPEPSQRASGFFDVDPEVWWGPYVELLADMGVVRGCGSGLARFCPHDAVTRAQLAALVVRGFGLGSGPSAGYVDIEDNTHAASVDALAAAVGAAADCEADAARFCPDSVVTRGQAAAFLHPLIVNNRSEGPPMGWVSGDVPDVDLIDVRSGETVQLRSLVDGVRPVLVWFWSPL